MASAWPDEDLQAEAAWRRMWRLHLLVAVAYIAAFLFVYWRKSATIPEFKQFYWEQGILSRQLLYVLGTHLAVMLVAYRKLWLYRWRRFFHEPLGPENLALLRILFSGFMLAHFIVYVPAHWSPLAALPHTARQPLPLVGWIIEAMPISSNLYNAVNLAGIIASGLAMAGLCTRPALLSLIPITFYIFGVPQFFGKLSHYHFFFWITVILAFAPTAEVWSMDAVLRRIRGERIDRRRSAHFALAIRLLMLTLAGIYFFSGVRKLYEIGLFWALSDNPVNLLRTEWLEQFQHVPWVRIDRWPWLCQGMSAGVIAFELAYPFLLLGRRTRLFAALDAVLFHNLNGYFLQIDFVYLKTAHLGYLDGGKMADWLRKRRSWGPLMTGWLWLIAAVGVLGGLVGVFFMFPVLLLAALASVGWRLVPRIRRGRLLLRLRKRLPAPVTATVRAQQLRRWARWSLATGATLVLLNSTCGLLGIHSWPFSSYPSYAFVRGDSVQYGWFVPTLPDGSTGDLDTLAQAAGLRKENILPMAERIAEAVELQDAARVAETSVACWLRWQAELPALKDVRHASVEVRTFALDPDRKDPLLRKTLIGHLELSEGKWIFGPTP